MTTVASAVKKKKAFADMADEETMTRERWANSKFVRHQLHIVLDNACPEAQPADDLTEAALTIQQEDFFPHGASCIGQQLCD
jgi:hypothetical protein